MIFDTDVLIWYFRGNENAKLTIESAKPFVISVITFMELLQGAKNKAEQQAIIKQLRKWETKIIHINESVSVRAMQYVTTFALSHGMAAMDALIAGTAVEEAEKILTGNAKHFDFIPTLTVKKFIP